MKKINIIARKAKKNIHQVIDSLGYANIHGELEIIGYKNGKQFHYDKSHNVVTVWAKHATMHLLTGETFSSHGTQRSFNEASDHQGQGDPNGGGTFSYGEGINTDGTMLSGQQYFSNNTEPDFNVDSKWSKSTIDPLDQTDNLDGIIHPFFPTKMLFGTGFEFENWAEITGLTDQAYFDVYNQDGWQSIFDAEVPTGNDYSNRYVDDIGITETRSMNDVYAAALSTEVLDSDFAISGAIKNGKYTNSNSERYDSGTGTEKTMLIDGNEFSIQDYRGVGKPSFIYSNRELRKFQGGSEIYLSADESAPEVIENKITYTVVMPEQTGVNAGVFYPYNGFTLKQAGLFCDARFVLGNDEPSNNSVAGFNEYTKMPYGMMIAKRNIAPIQKSHNVSIAARWTLYF